MNYPHVTRLVLILLVLLASRTVHAERFNQDLALDSTGTEVAFLQEVLCQQPDVFPDCVINGTYGAETMNAVIRFQYQVGFRPPSGSVDWETREWLNALIEDRTAEDFNAVAVQMLTTGDLQGLAGCLPGRTTAMERLFVVNPKKAREFAMPKALWRRVPKTMRYMVERDRMHVKGAVFVQTEEQFSPPYAVSERMYIRSTKGAITHITNRDSRLVKGVKNYARGLQLGTMLLPSEGTKDVRILGATSGIPPLPPAVAHLYVILLDFPDLPANQTRQAVFNAMNLIPPFYQASSGGKTTVDLHVSANWYHSSKTFASLKCTFGGMLNEALALANAEFDYRQATTVMFLYPGFDDHLIPGCVSTVTPRFSCPNGGAGGAIGIQSNYPTPDGPVTLGLATVTDGVVSCDPRRPRTQIHEFTHTVGAGGFSHSHALVCPQHSFEDNAITAGCFNGIDDPFDVMGNGNTNDFSPIVKENLGWLDSQSELSVTAPGTFTLGVYERANAANRILRLPGSTGRYFYVTYRQAEGIDAPPQATAAQLNGALIYTSGPLFSATDDRASYLLSAVPSTVPNINPNLAAFRLNQTLYDPVTQWAVTPIAQTANNLTVAVDKIPPLSCRVSDTKVAAGQDVTFTATGVQQSVTWSAPGGTPTTGLGSTFVTHFNGLGQFRVTYSLRASSGTLLSAVCDAVQVVNAPLANLTMANAHTVTVGQGGSINLGWASSNATACTLDGIAGTFAPPSFFDLPVSLGGSMLIGPVSDAWNFRLSCESDVGSSADYASLNTTSALTQPTTEGNNARCDFIGTSSSPFTEPGHQPGDTVHVTVAMRNTGTTTWKADATPHRLVLDDSGTATWSVATVPLPRVVPPGEQIVLSFDTQLESFPADAIVEPFRWRMAEDSIPFGQACVTRLVMVATTPAPTSAPDCRGEFAVWGVNGDLTNGGRGGSALNLSAIGGSALFDTRNKQEGSAALDVDGSSPLVECDFSECVLANPVGPFSAGCRVRPTGIDAPDSAILAAEEFGGRGGFALLYNIFGPSRMKVVANTFSGHGGTLTISAGAMRVNRYNGAGLSFDGTTLTGYLNGKADGVISPAMYEPGGGGGQFSLGGARGWHNFKGNLDECWLSPDAALTAVQHAWVWRCGATGEFCACSRTDPTSYFPCATNADCGGSAICTGGTCSGLDYGTCLDGAHANDACRVASQSGDCGVGRECSLPTLPACNVGGCF